LDNFKHSAETIQQYDA